MEGKTPVLKERLASLERMGDKIGEYFFSMEVGRGSRGDVLLGNALMAFKTSARQAGVLKGTRLRTAWVERMRWTMKRGCWRLIDECWRFSR